MHDCKIYCFLGATFRSIQYLVWKKTRILLPQWMTAVKMYTLNSMRWKDMQIFKMQLFWKLLRRMLQKTFNWQLPRMLTFVSLLWEFGMSNIWFEGELGFYGEMTAITLEDLEKNAAKYLKHPGLLSILNVLWHRLEIVALDRCVLKIE